MNFKKWLFEQQTNWKVIGYHRTNAAGVDFQSGFKKGERGEFGPGVYLFVNQTTIEKPNVIEKYGNNVIKAYCDLHGFLIFDKPTALSLYGTESLSKQLEIILGLNPLPAKLAKGIAEYENNQNYSVEKTPGQNVNGPEAVPYMLGIHRDKFNKHHQFDYLGTYMHPESLMRNLNLIDKIKGFYFFANTSTTKDFIIVAYSQNNITPIAFANVPNGISLSEAQWKKLNPSISLNNKYNQNSKYMPQKPELPPAIKKPFQRGEIVTAGNPNEKYIVLSTSSDGSIVYLKDNQGNETETHPNNLSHTN